MRKEYKPYAYQEYATQQIVDNGVTLLDNSTASMPLMEMGLGKTVATLTAIDRLIFDLRQVRRVLVVAPLRVAESVWKQEVEKWAHLHRLKVSVCTGPEKARKAALREDAHVYTINRENLSWLVALWGGRPKVDMVVLDESSSYKNAKAKRFKAMRLIRPHLKRIVLLTGTPTSNGLIDIWPQMFLADRGERLGKTITGFRETYFKAGSRNGSIVYEYNLRKGDALLGEDIYKEEIYEKIGDIAFSMKAKDYLQMPPLLEQNVEVVMPPELMADYLKFERDLILHVANEQKISAANAAVLTGKLLQYANGAVYREDKSYYEVHRLKLEALETDLEAANGHPFLLFYQFKHDLERIMRDLKEYKPRLLQTNADIVAWNKGEIPFLLAHPKSAGHGLNLQDGGHLMGSFGVTWSLEEYQQYVARLHRQGQKFPVVHRRYVTRGTMDFDVLEALDKKAAGQEALMAAVKARIERWKV